jgi:hypothetical protein
MRETWLTFKRLHSGRILFRRLPPCANASAAGAVCRRFSVCIWFLLSYITQ